MSHFQHSKIDQKLQRNTESYRVGLASSAGNSIFFLQDPFAVLLTERPGIPVAVTSYP